jgi:hypothetical protein
MRFGLRTRVAIAFGVISLVIAAAVSSATYLFASYYLLNQREDAALTRALLDSRAVSAALTAVCFTEPGTRTDSNDRVLAGTRAGCGHLVHTGCHGPTGCVACGLVDGGG